MTTELGGDRVLVAIDDLVVIPAPVFVTEIVAVGNMSYDVNLQQNIVHQKRNSLRHKKLRVELYFEPDLLLVVLSRL